MKKRVLMVLVMLAVALSTLGCWVGTVYIGGFGTVRGSDKVVEEEREVSDFTGVELATLGNLIIELGDEEELRIEAEDNLLQYIEAEVHGGTLKIGHRQKVTLVPTESIYFYLTVKELDTISVSGAGNVKVPDLEVAEFSLNISGGGNVDMEDLNADVLEVKISGAGNLYIEGGEVEEQEITISGAGNYKARGLESAEADVRVPGLGSATIRVRDQLKVNISGAGSVKYVGSPIVEQEVSGVGSIEQIGE